MMNGNRQTDASSPKYSKERDDEVRLIHQAKQGDKRAISALYQGHVDLVYRYVWARVQDEAVAEDLTAQVFLKALEALPAYEPSGRPFAAWLYRIAYARVVDHWRQRDRRVEVPLDEALPARGPKPGEFVEAEGDWGQAIDLLAQLTDDQQDVMILRFIGELSLAEVAETLGKTVGATKAIQHRALASLARMLEAQGGA